MTLKKSLLGGACLAIVPLLLGVISLPALALVIRQLGAHDYGQWTTAAAIVTSMTLLASLGLRGAFIRHLATHPEDLQNALAEQLGTRLLLAIGASFLAIVVSSLLGHSSTVLSCIAICCGAMVVNSVATTCADVLQALHRSGTIALITAVSGIALVVTSVLASLFGGGPIAIAMAYATGPIVMLVLSWHALRRSVPVSIAFRFGGMRTLLSRARAFTAQIFLNTAVNHIDLILLPHWLGPVFYGYFNAGTLLATRFSAIPDGLCTAAYPLLSKRFRHDRYHGRILAFHFGAIVTLSGLLIAILCALASAPLARLLFPSQPELCQLAVLISIWALPLGALDASLGYALNAAGHDSAQARALVPAAICNVLLTLVLITQLGLIGACVALPLRHGVRIVMLTFCCFRLRRPDPAPQMNLVQPAMT